MPNFIDDVFGGLTRSVVVCSRCCRPSVALERCMHTSVCFPAQLVDSLRPQRYSKSKNKTKAQNNNKKGGKGGKGGKNNGKRNQAESEEDLPSPRAPAGKASPETSPPPSGGKVKTMSYKQQQREFQRQKKANKGKGGFSNFEMLDEDAEEKRRQEVLERQKAKEDAETEALAQASGAANGAGAGSDDAGGAADTEAPDDADEPAFSGFDLFEESEDQLAVRATARLLHRFLFLPLFRKKSDVDWWL
jgi:hypothetical protein